MNITDNSIATSEIRQLLAIRFGERFSVDPKRFEDVVVGVYRDLGYDVEATGRTGDGGIDAVFRDRDGLSVGVQVKRAVNKIEVAQIREFAGALMIARRLRGVFVTTSSYTAGARRAASDLALRSLPIELVDAERFFAQLQIAQRSAYRSLSDPTAPFSKVKLVRLGEMNPFAT